MHIKREIEAELLVLIKEYPVVTILGPRQAGKTTLAKTTLPHYDYVNLEDLEMREMAQSDPKAFISRYAGNVVIDEIQRVPNLLSYIQVEVDANPTNGRYVLTGSHQLSLREAISQSLAGRTALLHLLPFSISELKNGGIEFEHFEDYCYTGFLPRIYEQSQRPTTAYSNYFQTYVERDVRQLIQLKDVSLFEKMLKLVAGRVGQVFEYSSLANDVGVDAKTIRHWVAILEASFILFKLPPYFENFGKRVIKSPKYYFTDLGLLCFLLGIRESSQVSRDPLVGQIFENLVVIEVLKSKYNRGEMPDLYFFRDSLGNEVDLLISHGRKFSAVEIKSATTFNGDQLKSIRRLQSITDRVEKGVLIYNGANYELSDDMSALNYKNLNSVFKI